MDYVIKLVDGSEVYGSADSIEEIETIIATSTKEVKSALAMNDDGSTVWTWDYDYGSEYVVDDNVCVIF